MDLLQDRLRDDASDDADDNNMRSSPKKTKI